MLHQLHKEYEHKCIDVYVNNVCHREEHVYIAFFGEDKDKEKDREDREDKQNALTQFMDDNKQYLADNQKTAAIKKKAIVVNRPIAAKVKPDQGQDKGQDKGRGQDQDKGQDPEQKN